VVSVGSHSHFAAQQQAGVDSVDGANAASAIFEEVLRATMLTLLGMVSGEAKKLAACN
jgi:hypothetical protein